METVSEKEDQAMKNLAEVMGCSGVIAIGLRANGSIAKTNLLNCNIGQAICAMEVEKVRIIMQTEKPTPPRGTSLGVDYLKPCS